MKDVLEGITGLILAVLIMWFMSGVFNSETSSHIRVYEDEGYYMR